MREVLSSTVAGFLKSWATLRAGEDSEGTESASATKANLKTSLSDIDKEMSSPCRIQVKDRHLT